MEKDGRKRYRSIQVVPALDLVHEEMERRLPMLIASGDLCAILEEDRECL